MTALIVLGSIGVYAFVGAMIGVLTYRFLKPHMRSDDNRQITAVCIAVPWPLGACVILGLMAGHWLTGFESRAKTRGDAKRLAHDRKMSEMREERRLNESALKVLEAEGVMARVTG